MSIQERNAYVCSDGEIFWTRALAEEHEAIYRSRTEAKEYEQACISAGLTARTAKRRSNIVAQYLSWQVTGTVSGAEPEETETADAA